MLPFTQDQFIGVFVAYNAAIWPAQIIAYALALALIALLFRPTAVAGGLVSVGLAGFWLWSGIAYHWLYFASVTAAARGFGALFVLQAVLFLYFGVVRGSLRFGPPASAQGWLGVAFLVYAMFIYPPLGIALGHAYAEIPWFGVAPCPTTIFTFGLLLLMTSPIPRSLLVVPFLWALIGGSAAVFLNVPQDWVLFACNLVAIYLAIRPGRRQSPPPGAGEPFVASGVGQGLGTRRSRPAPATDRGPDAEETLRAGIRHRQ